MKRVVRATSYLIAIVVSLVFFVSSTIWADDKMPTVSSPQEGGMVSNANLQITGKAPANTIITVTIDDTDMSRQEIAHEPSGQVIGSVTADNAGNWTYVPQHLLAPGQFTTHASYSDNENKTINSKPVRFVVINSQGSSIQLSESFMRLLMAIGGLVLFLAMSIVFFIFHRRRVARGKNEGDSGIHEQDTHGADVSSSLFLRTKEGQAMNRQLDSEVKTIEKEILQAAETLERLNQEISHLHKQLLPDDTGDHSEKISVKQPVCTHKKKS